MKQKIQFKNEGLVLVGNLYIPENPNPEQKYPAILVGGSWTTVKEQMSGLYAEALSKKGFVTLAIDPRYFGESEGNPRFYENPKDKIEDYKNAVAFLSSLPITDPEQIFLVSICASTGYMANVAADNKELKGFAAVASWLHDPEAVKLIYGGEKGVKKKISLSQNAEKKFNETGEVDYVPSISTINTEAAMFGEFDYYLNPKRGAIPQWSADRFAVMSWKEWLTFNPMPIAKIIEIPVLMIYSNDAVLGDYAKHFFYDIPHQNKFLHWTEGSQFDFYDQPKQVSEAVETISKFFKKLL